MSKKHPLEGLMKWAQRDQWREAFEEVLEQHLAPACEEMDVDLDQMPDLLDELVMVTATSCAFEELVAREMDGRNLADDYLKRRGWKESAATRAYIRALRQSVMSLYEVSGIRREEGFFLRDLIRGGEPFWVHEKSGTRGAAQWDRLAARVVMINGRAELSGALLSFDRDTADELIAELEAIGKKSPEELAEELARHAAEIGEEIEGDEMAELLAALKKHKLESTPDQTLASMAFMFTTHWLRQKLEAELGGSTPQVFNSDGEPYEPATVLYPLAPRATPRKVRTALARLSVLRQEGDCFWNWVETTRGHRKLEGYPKNSRMFYTELEDGSNVLGTIQLDEDALVLSVNSAGRVARGRELLEAALGDLVEEPEIDQEPLDENFEDAAEEDDDHDDDEADAPLPTIPPERQQEIMRQFLDDHYRRILDQPVAMLGNVSPRDAARSTGGREKVVDWIKSVENNHARQTLADPKYRYDCGWIWDDLGLGSRQNS